MTGENKLPTIDIPDQEILGVGTWPASPAPITVTDAMLTAFMEAAVELGTNTNYEPPIKLGHDNKQKLLQADGFPAGGWVHNIRKVGDKLFGDFKQVPAKLGEIILAGGYKKKSPELRKDYVSNGKTYPWVLTAVSILGADIPACKSISDIQALYAEEADAPIILLYEPDLDMQVQAVRDAYYATFQRRESLIPVPSEYVKAVFPDNIIVERSGALWKIPYTRDETGIRFDTDKAVQVEQVYQEITKKAAEAPATSVASEDKKLSEVEMEKELRQLLGIDEKADVLAAVKTLKEKAESNTVVLTEHESVKTKLAETESKLTEAQKAANSATIKLAEKDRDERVAKALGSGKIVPAQKAWADEYALKDPAGFDAFIAGAKKVIELGEKGAGGGDPNEVILSEEERKVAAQMGTDLEVLKKSKAAAQTEK